MIKTGIYKIENKVNGKAYIGQARNIDERWKSHLYCLTSNRHDNSYLQRAWNKHGKDNFEFKILQLCTIEELNDLEIKYIREYNSYTGFKNSKGYNMTLGGDGCARIADTVVFDGKVYTIHEATTIYGDSVQNLQNYLNGVTKMPKKYYDFGFRFENDNDTQYEVRKNAMHERVVCDNKLYDSIKDCGDYYNVGYNTMLSWLDGRRYMPQKFIDLELKYEHIETKIKVKPKIKPCGRYVYCDNKIYGNLKIFSLYNKLSYNMLKRWMCFPDTNNETLKDLLSKGLSYIDKEEALNMNVHIINHNDLREFDISEEDLRKGAESTKKKYNAFKVTDLLTQKEYVFESKKDYIRNSENVIGIKPAMMPTIRKYETLKQPYNNLVFEVVS